MGRRKCTPKQLAALKRGRKIAHRRSKKTTKGLFSSIGRAMRKAIQAPIAPISQRGAIQISPRLRPGGGAVIHN